MTATPERWEVWKGMISPQWYATSSDGLNYASFPTHAEAITYATRRANGER